MKGFRFTLPLLEKDYLMEDMTLILSVGIEMGTQVINDLIEVATKAGCARVLIIA